MSQNEATFLLRVTYISNTGLSPTYDLKSKVQVEVLPGAYLRRRRRATQQWSHQMETFSSLLAICAGNSLVTGEFRAQRPMTRSFDVFFDLHLNTRLSKQ